MSDQNGKKTGGFFNIIKNIFILLLVLQFAPTVFTTIKKEIQKVMVPKTHVAKLHVKGVISDSGFYIKKMEKFLKNDEIKALLLMVDSPGGLPGASQAIFDAVKRFKKEKPVVVFVENVCASGGYYVAMAGDYIVSTPSAFVGSIGVVAQIANVKELLNNWNIKFKYIQSGKYKTAGSPLRDLTVTEEEYLQQISDRAYKQFVGDVSKSRNISSDSYKQWADGKIFLGTEALTLKLIDQVGGFQDAVDKIKELAKIETEIKFVTPKKVSGLAKLFYGGEDGNDNGGGGFSTKTANFLNEVFVKFVSKQNDLKIG